MFVQPVVILSSLVQVCSSHEFAQVDMRHKHSFSFYSIVQRSQVRPESVPPHFHASDSPCLPLSIHRIFQFITRLLPVGIRQRVIRVIEGDRVGDNVMLCPVRRFEMFNNHLGCSQFNRSSPSPPQAFTTLKPATIMLYRKEGFMNRGTRVCRRRKVTRGQ